jgi:hypothetical protein
MSKTVCRLSQQGQGLIASFLTDPIQLGCATHKDGFAGFEIRPVTAHRLWTDQYLRLVARLSQACGPDA